MSAVACLTSASLSVGSGSATYLAWFAVGMAKGCVCHFPGNFLPGKSRLAQFPGKFWGRDDNEFD
ncbi:MAG: hypothetical protein CL608_17000 [Anaerolineaceae bacterium]|nr:hypothetical protein [Anaerolineaceae bacterium]